MDWHLSSPKWITLTKESVKYELSIPLPGASHETQGRGKGILTLRGEGCFGRQEKDKSEAGLLQ
ncbi:hypothetical protein E2C01_084191 [Portunus trituberculatus]|uniref:Uncharacterized protein n=1 Tax=Portunus trituberculatus TaxID=210409 RepID=A0A5B7JA19_PORTR|nr:hypothetical protein [Portunus trituberculatus]